jgi:hypothetical protein
MKNRQTIVSFGAQEVQKQINSVKNEHTKKKLQSRLFTTYLESYVDLDAEPKPQVVILCNRDRSSARTRAVMNHMINAIYEEYSQIDNVEVYGYTAFLEEYDNKDNPKPFPKSTVISDHMEQIGVDPIETDPHTRDELETFFDLRDSVFQKWNINPTLESHGNLEAGEIRVIIETVYESKHSGGDPRDLRMDMRLNRK